MALQDPLGGAAAPSRPTREEAAKILRLAGPLMLAQGGYMLMGVVATAVVGRVSALDMSAVALGNGVYSVLMVLGIGIGLGVEPLIGQAHGAGRFDAARSWRGQAIWVAIAVSPALMLMIAGATLLLVPSGISENIASRTTSYVLARLLGLPFTVVSIVQRAYLSNIGRPRPALVSVIWANILNLCLDLVLVFGLLGLPALGAAGAGWATTACAALMVAIQEYATRRIWREDGLTGALPRERIDLARARRIFWLGLPIGLQMSVEVGIFAAVAGLIGRIGEVELAAHEVAITLASLTFMGAVGVANATTARVGYHIGADRPGDARRAGLLGIGLGGAFMGTTGAIFVAFAPLLARLFTAEEPVIELGAALIRIAGVFAIADGIQCVSAGALRGAGDTRWPFWANVGAHWLIGLPVALALAHGAAMGTAGYWWGLTAGLIAVAITLASRFAWISARPIARLENRA